MLWEQDKDNNGLVNFIKCYYFNFIGRKQALLIGLIFGAVGVLLDFDHVVCALLGLSPFDPQSGSFGCRLFHAIYSDASWYLLCGTIAYLLGWFIYMAYKTIRTRT